MIMAYTNNTAVLNLVLEMALSDNIPYPLVRLAEVLPALLHSQNTSRGTLRYIHYSPQ